MKVFISWAGRGNPSDNVAKALHEWLPMVVQAVQPWLSSESLDAGTRWASDVAEQLEQSGFGIICVTPLSIKSDWLNFEAGAISKSVDKAKVVPYLIGMEPAQVSGPISQFQAIKADEAGTKRLIHVLNKSLEVPVEEKRLNTLFEMMWPLLQQKLDSAQAAAPAAPALPTPEAMLPEILDIVRAISRGMPELAAVAEAKAKYDPDRRLVEMLTNLTAGVGWPLTQTKSRMVRLGEEKKSPPPAHDPDKQESETALEQSIEAPEKSDPSSGEEER